VDRGTAGEAGLVTLASESDPAAIAAVPGNIAVAFDVAAAVVVVQVWVENPAVPCPWEIARC
jgi:hypothetical protein